MAAILIGLFVQQELSLDTWLPGSVHHTARCRSLRCSTDFLRGKPGFLCELQFREALGEEER